jgi:Fe-S cluster biogenesis protein NfuA
MSSQFLLNPEDILVRAQDTPNPRAIKFIVNYSLKEIGNATFTNASECSEMPLARDLFDIPGVEQIYFFQNTLTLTHSEELPADIIKNQAISVIRSRLPAHKADFESVEEQESKIPPDRSSLSPEIQKIEEILDRTIRPGLQSDGGDIEVLEVKNNEIKIMYQGACGGCPSSMMGTLDAIQSILRHELENEEILVSPI